MPKHEIYADPRHLPTSDPQALVVEVGWGKIQQSPGAHVTLAAYDKKTHSPHGSEADAAAGRMVALVPLGRDGVNRLIRALRKARDQAFGADA